MQRQRRRNGMQTLLVSRVELRAANNGASRVPLESIAATSPFSLQQVTDTRARGKTDTYTQPHRR